MPSMATFLILVAIAVVVGAQAEIPHKKFEYKYSFKGPYLAQKDGSIPFWTYGGSTIASEENVRVTPSLRSKKGFLWCKNQTNFDWWEIEILFRVTGRGRIGADGLAFWYTETMGVEGPVFGSNDQWKGLGLFFDSFDNDNKHNNPYIMGLVNDGNLLFDHQNDGASQQLSGCLRDYRNKPFPVRAKIEYFMNTLTVFIHSGMTDNEKDYEMCFRVDNVFLPKHGYFGISAATGGLADDHDIMKFLTSSLYTGTQHAQQQAISEMEKEKLAKEFEEYRTKLEQQKEEYRKEHPDKAQEERPEDWFETDQQRELGQIFQGQSRMFEVIRELHRKLDEIVGRQERVLSMLSSVQTGGGFAGQPSQPGQPGQPAITADSIRRHEVDSILNTQRDIVNKANEIKNVIGQIHQKTNTITTGQQGGAPTGGYEFQNFVNEMKEGLNVVKRDLSAVNAKTGPCTTQTTGCLSTTIFVIFFAIQLIIMIGYTIYRDSKAAQAKKFY